MHVISDPSSPTHCFTRQSSYQLGNVWNVFRCEISKKAGMVWFPDPAISVFSTKPVFLFSEFTPIADCHRTIKVSFIFCLVSATEILAWKSMLKEMWWSNIFGRWCPCVFWTVNAHWLASEVAWVPGDKASALATFLARLSSVIWNFRERVFILLSTLAWNIHRR